MKGFGNYFDEAAKWITFVEGDFYPDAIQAAIPIYRPLVQKFGELLRQSRDSQDLLHRIADCPMNQGRVQLLRIFRKYVSPDTSVEMLKKKTRIPEICVEFGDRFRDVNTVTALFDDRPDIDEALIALLNEYRDRGQKGYELTAMFFEDFHARLDDSFDIYGPTGAGKDLNLADWLPDYPKDRRPVDFVITEKGDDAPLIIGLARYDSDRGGAQEDDRTSGYRNVVTEVLSYADQTATKLKLLFVNDGPGLLLGSMWLDYSEIEGMDGDRVMVSTLKMLPDRLTVAWIRS